MNLFDLPGPVGGLTISFLLLLAGVVLGCGIEIGRELVQWVKYRLWLWRTRESRFFLDQELHLDMEDALEGEEGVYLNSFDREMYCADAQATQPLYERELSDEELEELERIMYEGQ